MKRKLTERKIYSITTLDELEFIVNNNMVVILKASAEWCGPCKMISPLFYELLDGLKDNIVLINIDIDNAIEIKRKLKICSIPFIANFVNGEITDIINTSNKDDIKRFFIKTNNN